MGIVIDYLNHSEEILISYLVLNNSNLDGKFRERISNSDLKSGYLDESFEVFLDNIITVDSNKCKIVGELEIDKLDKILRTFTHYISYNHFKNITDKKSRDYIPSSGKIVDETELFNMIDASLDMWLTAGRFDEAFTDKFSELLGINHVLTTNSGSSANLLAITALTSNKLGYKKLNEGDEVITTAVGFPTTVAPIIQNNLVPVFVDVILGTYNVNIEQLEEAISDRTRAIFLAHTLGNPFDIKEILKIAEKYNLWLIEDNCDALCSKYSGKLTGTFGHISTFSFYPAHHITMGEGGTVATND